MRYVEQKLRHSTPDQSLSTPDILLMLSAEVLVFDNLAGTLTLIITVEADEPAAYETAIARLDALEAKLPLSGPPLESISLNANDVSAIEARAQYATSQEEFEEWVTQIKDYILWPLQIELFI